MKLLESQNDLARLTSVRETAILDTPNEEVLDQLVELAAAICHTPIALISIVDRDRQWFKARHGLAVSETPREGSFCSEVIWEPDLCIIRDAALDPRFARSAFVVKAPFIRFYAGVPIFNSKGHALGTLCIMDKVPRDLTALQQQTLRTLAKSVEVLVARKHELQQRFADSAHFRSIFEHETDSIKLVARDGTLVEINPTGLLQLGAESLAQVRGSNLLAFVARKDRPAFQTLHEKALGGETGTLQYESTGLGEKCLQTQTIASPVRDADGRIVAVMYITRDVTEKEKLERQFLRAQRLENLGMLAAGIAHDLNNILAPMMMLSPLLADRLTLPADRRLLAAVDTNARRGAGLVKQILSFAHGEQSDAARVDLKIVAGDISAMIAETFPHNIRLITAVAPDLHEIPADPTQIHQVLLNLCVNARDAMPRGGELRLEIQNCTLGLAAASVIPDGHPGHYVLIEVADNGTGIPAEIQGKIWEPFFTTKAEGQGTGLGLSTVRSIIKRHGGFGTLESSAAAGTRFRFYLPVEKSTGAAPHDATPPVTIARGQGQTILVVDDEPDVRAFLGSLLEQAGYRTLNASNGKDAIDVFQRECASVALVVSESELKDMGATELAGALRRIKPDIPLLFCTAGAETNLPPLLHELVLLKPFDANELFGAVQDLLADHAKTAPNREDDSRNKRGFDGGQCLSNVALSA